MTTAQDTIHHAIYRLFVRDGATGADIKITGRERDYIVMLADRAGVIESAHGRRYIDMTGMLIDADDLVGKTDEAGCTLHSSFSGKTIRVTFYHRRAIGTPFVSQIPADWVLF